MIAIDAGHFNFTREPAVLTVAEHLNAILCDATVQGPEATGSSNRGAAAAGQGN